MRETKNKRESEEEEEEEEEERKQGEKEKGEEEEKEEKTKGVSLVAADLPTLVRSIFIIMSEDGRSPANRDILPLPSTNLRIFLFPSYFRRRFSNTADAVS